MLLLILVMLPAHAFAIDFDFGSTWRSVLIPGSGQAHQGHYKKAAIFAGVTIISATGLFLFSISYTEAVDKYNDDRTTYLGLAQDLESGEVVSYPLLTDTWTSMNSNYDDAESRYKWRTAFAIGLVAAYTINIVDILLSDPHDPDTAMNLNYGVDYTKERVLLVRSWRF